MITRTVFVFVTLEVALGPEIADAEPEDRELVELGDDALLKRQKARQVVQLPVQALPVTFARVALRRVLRRSLHTGI